MGTRATHALTSLDPTFNWLKHTSVTYILWQPFTGPYSNYLLSMATKVIISESLLKSMKVHRQFSLGMDKWIEPHLRSDQASWPLATVNPSSHS